MSGAPAGSDGAARALVAGSVDVYDAAARLESGGYGDLHARRLGYADVFGYAQSFGPTVPEVVAPYRLMVRDQRQVWARAVLLVAAVLLFLRILPQDTVASMFAAASAGWLAAQVTSAGLYWGLGRLDVSRGARLALTALLPLFALGLAVAIPTGWWEMPLWMVGGFAAAYANTIVAALKLSLAVLAAAVAIFLLPASLGAFPAAALILGLGGWAFTRLVWHARQGGTPSASGWLLVVWSLISALALQAVLLVLLVDDQVGFAVIALAGTASGVLGGPMLEQTVRSVIRLTHSHESWEWVRRRMYVIALTFITLLGALAVVACLLTAWGFQGRPLTSFEWAASFLIGALSACSGILMCVGTARGAALTLVAAALGVVLVALTLNLHTAAGTVAVLIISVVAGLGAAHRLARPGWW